MANYQFPFDAEIVDGAPDRSYQAEVWAKYFSSFIGNGIFYNPADSLKVSEVSGNNSMHVVVKAGAGFINGRFFYETDDTLLGVEQSEPVLNRIDSVVLRCDYIQRIMSLAVKKGTPDTVPKAPTLTRNNDIHELRLANISVPYGSLNIPQSSITDTRLNKQDCGIVASVIENIDTTDLYNQYKSAWDNVYAKMLNHSAQFSGGFLCFGVAQGTGNYTVNADGFTLVKGAEIKVEFTNGFNGQATLNVNGSGAINITRANGTPYNIVAGSIQRLTYNGTNFLPVGEGGWGTARPEQVLKGVTASNDEGFFNGAMPENATIIKTLTTHGDTINIPAGYYPQQGRVTAKYPDTKLTRTLTKHNEQVNIPVGYYPSGSYVKAVISGMNATSILKPNVIGGVTGTFINGTVATKENYRLPSGVKLPPPRGTKTKIVTRTFPRPVQYIHSTGSYFQEALFIGLDVTTRNSSGDMLLDPIKPDTFIRVGSSYSEGTIYVVYSADKMKLDFYQENYSSYDEVQDNTDMLMTIGY